MAEWVKSKLTGEISEIIEGGDAFKLKGQSGRSKKIWCGPRRYKGEKIPAVGSWITAHFSTSPDVGSKKGSNYLDSWTPAKRPSQLSVVPPAGQEKPSDGSDRQRFVGREPGTADYFHAMRWAYSLAADLTAREGKTRPSVSELSHLANELFRAAYIDAIRAQEEHAQLEQPAPAKANA